MSDKVIATITGHLGLGNGRATFVTAGAEYDAGDEVVRQHPALFETAEGQPARKPARKAPRG